MLNERFQAKEGAGLAVCLRALRLRRDESSYALRDYGGTGKDEVGRQKFEGGSEKEDKFWILA
jgi:hypothetical protein